MVLFIFLASMTLILSKMDELSIFKALVCVNIITSRRQKEDLEPNILSPIILSCYMKITDEQVHRLTEGIEQGLDIPLSDEEIDNLMDIESLKDLPENEVRKKGDELEEAIKEFQKIQEGYGDSGDNDGYDDDYGDGDDDYDYEDYEGQRNNISSKGLLRLFKKGIISLTEIFFSSWYIIGILVLFYVLLLEIRRNNDDPNNNENKEEKEKEEKKEEDAKNEINNKDEKQKEDNEEDNKELKEEKKIEEEKIIKEEEKIEEKKIIKEKKTEKEIKKEENDSNIKEKQD